MEVKESRELVNRLPCLEPFDSIYYSFPTLNETFPSLDVDFSKTVRLYFAAAAAGSDPSKRTWKRSGSSGRDDHQDLGGRLSSMSNPHFRDEKTESENDVIVDGLEPSLGI